MRKCGSGAWLRSCGNSVGWIIIGGRDGGWIRRSSSSRGKWVRRYMSVNDWVEGVGVVLGG